VRRIPLPYLANWACSEIRSIPVAGPSIESLARPVVFENHNKTRPKTVEATQLTGRGTENDP
jgi:hypothetical protein